MAFELWNEAAGNEDGKQTCGAEDAGVLPAHDRAAKESGTASSHFRFGGVAQGPCEAFLGLAGVAGLQFPNRLVLIEHPMEDGGILLAHAPQDEAFRFEVVWVGEVVTGRISFQGSNGDESR